MRIALRPAVTLAIGFVLLAPNGLHAEDTLATRIEKVLHEPAYAQAHWGILVVDAASGEPIFACNPNQLFRPASTTKLFTCASALAALGADHRFVTPVYRRGEVAEGRLRGDLILVAQGDLSLGGRTLPDGTMAFTDGDHTYANGNDDAELIATDPLSGLNELARQVAAAGIRRIDGDILIDDRLFEHSRGSGSGPQFVTPVVVNDNVVDLVVTAGAKAGEPATVRMRPETAFFHLDAQVATVAATGRSRLEIQDAGEHGLVVRGQVPLRKKPHVRIFPVPNPTAFARGLFIEALQRAGVGVRASALQNATGELPEKASYGKLPCVARFTSPRFAEAIKVTLKVSHNLYASTLPLLVAVHKGKRTLADGLTAERQFLADLGVPTDTISFGGGAGGANADHVTPQATVQLLRALSKRPEYAEFHAALPILGVDGTLATAVPEKSPARGKAQAKTGTLSWHDLLNDRTLVTSKALAGTLTTASGRTLTFAMFVNNVPLPRGVTPGREGRTLGRLCEILYEHVP